ncbi:YceI family protein [Paenibacillus sp. S150]|uniref:YceI family protein n=1 Tax=Paenibacillus sp. S150 TaxID=2749826 RepID=UPI001C59285E|nr:YceI family protein [Paenibacillus sp. S150]MBW4082378.1 YceI family protein [Paenibacillus sp. S150]
MNKKTIAIVAAGVVIALAITAFTLLNNSLGNNVEIESVIPTQDTASNGTNTANTEAAPAGTAVTAEQLNGAWSIADTSKVYWSVTTSQETVNFVDPSVTGTWNVNLDDASAMTGEGTVEMSALDSGNGQRDEHVKGEDFLSAAEFPQSTFEVESFSELPAEWTEGTAVPVQLTGTMTVKGIEKEVTFDSQAVYSGGQLMLSGTTTVTFADFGLTNPHSIVLDTENELEVRLELVLSK